MRTYQTPPSALPARSTSCVGGLPSFRSSDRLGIVRPVKWRRADERRERAEVDIDVRARLAPFVGALSAGDEPELDADALMVMEPADAPEHQPRHLAS